MTADDKDQGQGAEAGETGPQPKQNAGRQRSTAGRGGAAGSADKGRNARPVRPARGLALLALLLALVALTLSLWQPLQARGWLPALPWLESEPSEPAAAVTESQVQRWLDERLSSLPEPEEQDAEARARIADLEARLDSLRGRLRRELDQGLDELAAELGEERRELAQVRRALGGLADEVATTSLPDSRQWRIAEAGYLLRIANQRARLEHDVPGALRLVRAAEDILEQIDDYRLVPVREALVAAEAELAAQPQVDPVGLYLNVEREILRLSEWPLTEPGFQRDDETPAQAADDTEPGGWQALQARLRGLFEFRRSGDSDASAAAGRPLAPTEQAQLRQQLHLKLLHAQLALLKRQPEVWEQSLETAADWAARMDHAPAQGTAERLRALARETVRPDIPDISAPLRQLQRVQAGGEEPES